MQDAQLLRGAQKAALRTEAIIVSIVIVMVAAIYIVSPVTTSTDSAWTFHVAASILQQHNVNLDEYRPLMDLSVDYRLRQVNGHIYSYYPVATPLLVTPAVWLINALYPLAYPADFYSYLLAHAPDMRTARLEKLIAAVIVAAAAGLMYLVGRRELIVAKSLLITFIFAFATSMWSTASRALWQHGPSALFLLLALYLLPKARERKSLFLWIGLILGFSYLIRPTNSLAVGFIGLYVLLNYRRDTWLYVLGLILVFIPYITQNWFTYGNPLPPYSYQLFERLSTPGVFGEALAGTLISPARGLFVFSSVFLFSIYGAWLRIRNRMAINNLDVYLAGILLMHWVMTSLFEDWGGAWSIGPRYFVDVIPLLVYFLIPVVQTPALASPTWRAAFVGTILLSTFIQWHCSTSIDPFMWNGKPRALVQAPERKWDWGDLQFLRGFCARNPLEGRAPACWFDPNG